MLDFIRQNNTTLLNKWFDLIEGNEVDYFNKVELPKVTVFCPLYAGERYIENFLESIKNQTIFDQCELIIIDANSPENEEKYIRKFMKTHKNVIYKKLGYRATVMETENMALKMATGEFFSQACVDDRHSPHYLEILAKHLHYSTGIDLVYADCYQTTAPNETFENNSAQGNFYEHSRNSFSKENMIKCLPGPMPMWKKSAHEKAGYFNPTLAHAGDWEMFLRMVDAGFKFKKVNIPLGLYYYNNEGLSTSAEHSDKRLQEESAVFFKYKEIFGQRNFDQYKGYFQQFMRE
jgi:glycosyltransferase involved in cell wall biosynthesis